MRYAGQIVRGGYFGSYARGDAGVGSDIDIVVTVTGHDLAFVRRSATFDTTHLPVPADLLVYTEEECAGLATADSRFARVLRDETVWVV
ncbi:MAG: nucleotidyltransferase domain-containing protein [Spirochaetales bacterium]|nr:nucleotidyltransferase domain-containing protein [Spirochaetales bacterium]